ncbi:MAG: aminopeptidase N C-terminal domain-containing protein [Planctomycetota bacterium]
MALGLPSERVLAQEFAVVDPAAIHAAARGLCRALRGAHAAALRDLYDANAPAGPYSNDKASIDRRRLRNLCLDVLCCDRSEASAALATAQFDAADNMTDSIAALRNLAEIGGPRRDAAIDDFHARWQADPLVLDKWFTVQALSTADDGFDRVRALAEHPDFLLRNPNRFRSLVGAFGMLNQVHFHRPDGAGYRFLADQVLAVDPVNAQVAARVVSCFNQWKRFEPGRRALMLDQLRRIRGTEALSKDVGEIVDRALAQADDAEARA